MTRTAGLTCVAAAALSIAAAQGGPAQAAPLGLAAGGLRAAADDISSVVEPAQFVFGGREYCFYLDGWHGPGWYWCGYAFRRGFGWGGPRGWHGWQHDGHRPHVGGPVIRPHVGGPVVRPHVGGPVVRPHVGGPVGRSNFGHPGGGRPGGGHPGGGHAGGGHHR